MPKVSIIIPAYNAMNYLSKALESALNQTLTDIEVIIVDDGSLDDIQSWAKTICDPRVIFISQENQGVSVARNNGIALAQGEYIAFLDADDILEPTKIEKQAQCLDRSPEIDLVHTWIAVVDEQNRLTGRLLTSETEGYVWKEIVQENTIAGATVMARRRCFEEMGGFVPRGSYPVDVEDWEMWIRLATRYSFAVIREPLYRYRQHPGNSSKNWRSLEHAIRIVTEKAFANPPAGISTEELSGLKAYSYARSNLSLAWKALQSVDCDYKRAKFYIWQAKRLSPQICAHNEYRRLSVAIRLIHWLQPKGYQKALEVFYALRRMLPRLQTSNKLVGG